MNKKLYTKDELLKIFQTIWDEKTTSDPEEYLYHDKSFGQCVVTSLVINKYYGRIFGNWVYKVVKSPVVFPDGTQVSHYCNLSYSGTYLDLTFQQFPVGTYYSYLGTESVLDYVMSNPNTVARFDILFERFKEKVKHNG